MTWWTRETRCSRSRVERGPGTASYVTLPPAETVITITDDDEVPGKPALSAAFGDMAATLNWTAPGDPGTSPVDGYDYRRSADGGTTWDPDWSEVPGGASAASHTVESLANGTEYTFEVRARSAAGDGEASETGHRHAGHHAGRADGPDGGWEWADADRPELDRAVPDRGRRVRILMKMNSRSD